MNKLKFKLNLFNRKFIFIHSREIGVSVVQNKASIATILIIITTFLIIWLITGLILAYWVKNDLKKRNLKSLSTFILIVLTSFIGFMIYIITNRGERGILENEPNFPEVDDTINYEKEAEFHDEIEETIEEEVEDAFVNILEEQRIKKD